MRTVSADFAGVKFPPGTKVSFVYKDRVWEGMVIKLLLKKARVMLPDKRTFKVPYQIMRVLEPTDEQVSLVEIENKANELLKKHNLSSWEFAFDLAENRSGCCYYARKLICMSVTYCMKATKAEILNTLLHEIAHALTGPGFGHSRAWRMVAQNIGCTAERCHSVKHTLPKYVGTCLCPKMRWERHRLTQKARTGHCPRCLENVKWEINTEF